MIREELFTLISAVGDRKPHDWYGYVMLADKLRELVDSDAEALAGMLDPDGPLLGTITTRIKQAKRSKGNGQRRAEAVVIGDAEVRQAHGVLAENGSTGHPLTFAEWYAFVDGDMTKPQLSKCIRRLISSGTIVDTGKGRGKRYSIIRRDSTPPVAAEAELRASEVPIGGIDYNTADDGESAA